MLLRLALKARLQLVWSPRSRAREANTQAPPRTTATILVWPALKVPRQLVRSPNFLAWEAKGPWGRLQRRTGCKEGQVGWKVLRFLLPTAASGTRCILLRHPFYASAGSDWSSSSPCLPLAVWPPSPLHRRKSARWVGQGEVGQSPAVQSLPCLELQHCLLPPFLPV